jgi:hypothetical protein
MRAEEEEDGGGGEWKGKCDQTAQLPRLRREETFSFHCSQAIFLPSHIILMILVYPCIK